MMRWAEVSAGTVSHITISKTVETGAEWLNANVGGEWVEVADGVEAGIGYGWRASTSEFVRRPDDFEVWTWDVESEDWIQ